MFNRVFIESVAEMSSNFEDKIWDRNETLSRDELTDLQLKTFERIYLPSKKSTPLSGTTQRNST